MSIIVIVLKIRYLYLHKKLDLNMYWKHEINDLCSRLFQSYDNDKKSKLALSSKRVDELRLLIPNESNGINAQFLESTHDLPKFHTFYCCGEKVGTIEDDNPLVFL